MRCYHLRWFPLATCLFTAACGSKSKDVAATGDPNTIAVNESGVSLGGVRVGDAPGEDSKKHDALWNKLSARRDEQKAANPAAETPGLTLDLGPNVTCRAFMSIYVSAVFAGFPRLTVKQGAITVDLPGFAPKGAPKEDDPRDMFAAFQADGSVALTARRCGGAYDVVPAASLADTVKELCGQKTGCLGMFELRCDAGVPMSKMLPALEAVRKISPKMEVTGGETCTDKDGPWTIALAPGAAQPPAAAPSPSKKPPRAEIRVGAVIATGGLTSDEVQEALKPRLADVKACYDEALTRNPNVQGRVMARLTLGKKGAVMMADNTGSDIPDFAVVSCAIRAISKATFPAKGAISVVSYPLMFTPK